MYESPESRQPRTVHWRNRFILCVVGFSIAAMGGYFGPQTVSYWRARSLAFRGPELLPRGWSSSPRPLDDTIASAAKADVLSYFGYQFEVPWDGIEKESGGERYFEVRFKTGQLIRFTNPRYSQDDPISSQTAHDPEYFNQAFGMASPEPKYDQFKAVVSMTPSEWSPFRSHREFARGRVLLQIKSVWFEHNPVVPDIYSFNANEYRGFEVSGLSHDWEMVSVHMFDRADRQFQIVVLEDPPSGLRLTQREINRVIQSFGPSSISGIESQKTEQWR